MRQLGNWDVAIPTQPGSDKVEHKKRKAVVETETKGNCIKINQSVSLAVVNTRPKATWGGKGLFGLQAAGQRGGKQRQELKQRPQSTAASWLASPAGLSVSS